VFCACEFVLLFFSVWSELWTISFYASFKLNKWRHVSRRVKRFEVKPGSNTLRYELAVYTRSSGESYDLIYLSCRRSTQKELWCISDNSKIRQEGEMREMKGTLSTQHETSKKCNDWLVWIVRGQKISFGLLSWNGNFPSFKKTHYRKK